MSNVVSINGAKKGTDLNYEWCISSKPSLPIALKVYTDDGPTYLAVQKVKPLKKYEPENTNQDYKVYGVKDGETEVKIAIYESLIVDCELELKKAVFRSNEIMAAYRFTESKPADFNVPAEVLLGSIVEINDSVFAIISNDIAVNINTLVSYKY